ncbi:MAG: ComEC/Rec2 family competence protein [Desulfovibrionaceae bacterium]|nr:ComEC/Rec2 family competence protein [Desulfovibrionaceae bacterium]
MQNFRTCPLLAWQIILLFAALGTLVPKLGITALPAISLLLLASLFKIRQGFTLIKVFVHLFFCCAGFGVGLLAALCSIMEPSPLPAWAELKTPQRLTARVEQVDAMPGERVRIILAEAEAASAGETEPEPLSAKLAWTWMKPDREVPLPGQLIEVNLRVRPIGGMLNPGVFNIEEYWLDKGVGFRAWTLGEKGAFTVIEPAPFWNEARSRLQQRMFAALLPEAASEEQANADEAVFSSGKAIIPALLTGNKYHLTQRQLDLFAAASLSHSLALSGLHLGLMAGIGSALAFGLCRLRPQIMLSIPRSKLAVLFAAPLVLIYLWLGGITPSLLRSALMFACMGWLLWRGRPHIIMDGLFWAVLIMLLLNPLSLHDLRLQLSAACIMAIALALPWAARIAHALFPARSRLSGWLRGIVNLLFISLAIQLLLLPLQTSAFGQATPCFVINLLWLPVLSSFVFPLSLLGLVCSIIPGLEGAAVWTFNLAAWPGDLLFALLEWLDEHSLLYAPAVARPLPAAALGYWALVFILAALGAALMTAQGEYEDSHHQKLKEKKKIVPPAGTGVFFKNQWAMLLGAGPQLPMCNPLLILLLMGSWLLIAGCLLERWQGERPAGPRLTLIDVGQGQALLLEGMEGQRILVDGGGLPSRTFDVGRSVLAPVLTLNRPPRLSAVINSHPDHDHIGGLLYLIQKFQIDKLYLGQGVPKKDYGEYVSRLLNRHDFIGERSPALLRAGDEVRLDSLHTLLTLYPPWEPAKSDKPQTEHHQEKTEALIRKSNNYSIVLQLRNADRGLALACGDLEESGLKKLLKTVRAGDVLKNIDNLNSEILILPHHGSKNSFNTDFYDDADPQVALASAGFGNQWGFPVELIRNEFAARGVPLYSTSDYGQIRIQWNEAGEKEIFFARMLK